MSQSEVAHLRQQIALTCEAMYQGLHGYAVTAKHALINAKYHQLEAQQTELARLIGEEEALTIIYETMDQAASVHPAPIVE